MKLVLIGCFLLSQWSFAAVKKRTFNDSVALTLRQPHHQAVERIKMEGPSSLGQLRKIAFTNSLPMKTRWKSFMVYSEVAGKKAVPEIKKALQSKTWFMRSAGLMAMDKVDQLAARKWAYQKLLSDKALMVRMKALEILQKRMDEKVIELFWEKLYSKDSFHHNKSLWIREDLARQLARVPRKKDVKRWARLLHDKGHRFQKMASLALQKISGDAESLNEDISYWQKKYPNKRAL